ncbi:RNA 2'-phosphotransferase [Paenibacillus mendelii]|uniref:Probable RNA 2'-phosphotransferase n=1 Tax=Paenibacillus mendelii TaxID=206163 RepID=A0ABV6J9P6_9BACL|nr:RNA 2'-phosphotransferase [Paenibacillus mendelii]MCQ6563776.1 RNA 2'-phosphotransferase [Paenibacillus mendelii]
MKQSKQDIELGRFLSLVLRHQPSAAGIKLDAQGWADVRQLLAGCNRVGKQIDRVTLERIVKDNSKQRYRFNDDRTKIRANQGHSLAVDVELQETTPPDVLYHGTASRFVESIRAEGIKKGSRQHVHLSKDIETAIQVGGRHGKPVLLPVDAAAMYRSGHKFYLSENGVWLCDYVPREYVLNEEA